MNTLGLRHTSVDDLENDELDAAQSRMRYWQSAYSDAVAVDDSGAAAVALRLIRHYKTLTDHIESARLQGKVRVGP